LLDGHAWNQFQFVSDRNDAFFGFGSLARAGLARMRAVMRCTLVDSLPRRIIVSAGTDKMASLVPGKMPTDPLVPQTVSFTVIDLLRASDAGYRRASGNVPTLRAGFPTRIHHR
jgi:hypothetical protein